MNAQKRLYKARDYYDRDLICDWELVMVILGAVLEGGVSNFSDIRELLSQELSDCFIDKAVGSSWGHPQSQATRSPISTPCDRALFA